MLYYLYTGSLTIVELITTPDIDMDAFSLMFISNINLIRSKIPCCNETFDKITSLVSLLCKNFSNYYHEYVTLQTGNSSIIIEQFLMDVSNNCKATPTLALQFRKIITHFHKVSEDGKESYDPKIKNLMNFVYKDLNVMNNKK